LRLSGGLKQFFLADYSCSNCSNNFVFLFVFGVVWVESSVPVAGFFGLCLVGAAIIGVAGCGAF